MSKVINYNDDNQAALNAVTDHEAKADPHPIYLTQAEADLLYANINLTAQNALWSASTTVPTNPIANLTRWWNPTEQIEWFWNDTYWLSSYVYQIKHNNTWANTGGRKNDIVLLPKLYKFNHNLYFEQAILRPNGNTPQDNSNYWTIYFTELTGTSTYTDTTLIAKTQLAPANFTVNLDKFINVQANSTQAIGVSGVRTGTPGNLILDLSYLYRIARI